MAERVRHRKLGSVWGMLYFGRSHGARSGSPIASIGGELPRRLSRELSPRGASRGLAAALIEG